MSGDKKINAGGNNRPTEMELYEHVAPYLGEKWNDLAYRLLLDKDTHHIPVISANNRAKGVTECAKELLRLWLTKNYPNTTWNKLITDIKEEPVELAYLAKQIKDKLLPDSVESGKDASKESTAKGQSGKGVDIKPEGYPPNSRTKEGETKNDVDEDGAKSTNNVKPAKPDTADPNNTAGERDESNGEAQGERPTRSVAYPPAEVDESCNMKEYKISKEKPAFAIIFDNEKVHGGDFRTGTEEDQRSICSLMEDFKEVIDFHKYIVKNLTKKEMIGAFKMLGKPNPSHLDDDEEINGAIKLFHKPEEHDALVNLPKNAKNIVLNNSKVDLSKYSCFMAFIMAHGNEKGICGADGKQLKVDTLSSYLTPKECGALENMPKIFFLQYCRGREMDLVMDDDLEIVKDDKTPNTADFLYVYATPENHKAMRFTTGTLFIQTLVEVMKKTLYHYHFEEVLFFVKNEMGRTTVKYDRKSGTDQKEILNRKQILSVVSQMRGRIFFVED